MQIRCLEEFGLNEWVKSLVEAAAVYGPVRREDQFVFDRL